MMNTNNLLSRIEALLFVAGDEGMTVKQLAQYIEVEPMDIEAGLSELLSHYNEEEMRGITLKQLAGTYQLTTKPEVTDTLKKLIENPTNQVLTAASLEVLAIIAYKQPITRAEVEDLRGVKSERPIATLVSRALVQEVGRAEGTGRAILYGTTKEFLNYFGLKNIKELPPLPEEVDQEDDQPTDLFLTKFQETFNQN
ncbi:MULTISPECIES: SMC-Scp complex subunit ScpB [Solibacillus]|uniref:Segregation and condensation protein B n=3 Tax=Solibacillus TaxID=648800 RepID=F2FAN5_SOLSS|nr:SMC-Scp complex subunit ScpB [Solibacillus silvestris]OUZ37934.1 SMC-Scp complex subunit ScpB [Solibacillus kalamii]BAK17201.1 predicted transcriptional regulator containing the HTH domain [Solibacillus silvestris StLB046]